MIPVRRECWSDSLIPEGWGRSRQSYLEAAGKASSRASKPNTHSAQGQAERFARRREKDEQFKRELLS